MPDARRKVREATRYVDGGDPYRKHGLMPEDDESIMDLVEMAQAIESMPVGWTITKGEPVSGSLDGHEDALYAFLDREGRTSISRGSMLNALAKEITKMRERDFYGKDWVAPWYKDYIGLTRLHRYPHRCPPSADAEELQAVVNE